MKRPVTEYDGPTINGRPILGINEVRKWFAQANCVASIAAAKSIAEKLNHCAFLAPLWKDTPELKRSRENNPSLLRARRIGEALRTLQSDLPALIDETLKVFPERRSEELDKLVSLVNVIAPGYQKYKPPGRGRKPESWHNIARNLGPVIVDVFKAAGRRVGFGKPTGPAVTIMLSALAYLGIETSSDAIVDAMRPIRKRKRLLGK